MAVYTHQQKQTLRGRGDTVLRKNACSRTDRIYTDRHGSMVWKIGDQFNPWRATYVGCLLPEQSFVSRFIRRGGGGQNGHSMTSCLILVWDNFGTLVCLPLVLGHSGSNLTSWSHGSFYSKPCACYNVCAKKHVTTQNIWASSSKNMAFHSGGSPFG